SRRRHTRCYRDWSSDVCSSDLSGLISFHAVIPSRFIPAVVAGVVIALALVVGLVGLRFSQGWFSRWLPHRYRDRARTFKRGLLRSEERRVGKEWRALMSSEYGR